MVIIVSIAVANANVGKRREPLATVVAEEVACTAEVFTIVVAYKRSFIDSREHHFDKNRQDKNVFILCHFQLAPQRTILKPIELSA